MENQNNTTPEQTTEQAPVVEQAAAPEAPQTPADNGKGQSIAALVLGILGIVGGWVLGIFSAIPVIGTIVNLIPLICAILGIVFGVKGRQQSVAANGKASGLATAGLVLGIIGTAFASISVLCNVVCVSCSIASAVM